MFDGKLFSHIIIGIDHGRSSDLLYGTGMHREHSVTPHLPHATVMNPLNHIYIQLWYVIIQSWLNVNGSLAETIVQVRAWVM